MQPSHHYPKRERKTHSDLLLNFSLVTATMTLAKAEASSLSFSSRLHGSLSCAAAVGSRIRLGWQRKINSMFGLKEAA